MSLDRYDLNLAGREAALTRFGTNLEIGGRNFRGTLNPYAVVANPFVAAVIDADSIVSNATGTVRGTTITRADGSRVFVPAGTSGTPGTPDDASTATPVPYPALLTYSGAFLERIKSWLGWTTTLAPNDQPVVVPPEEQTPGPVAPDLLDPYPGAN